MINKYKKIIGGIISDYIFSIRWKLFFIYYILFTVVVLFESFTLSRFLNVSGIFFIISLIAWGLHKLEDL